MTFPDGMFGRLDLSGRARDLLTPADSSPVVLAEDRMQARLSPAREISEITVEPARAGIERLVGARGGGKLRAALDDVVPDDRRTGTPLSQLLDDIAGSSLIAGFAWSRFGDDWKDSAKRGAPTRSMEGVCSGFRPGSSALGEGGAPLMRHNVVPVPPLVDPSDPLGWHALEELPLVAMRRARRIDVWRSGDEVVVDAMFRDLCHDPDGSEVAVHEYRLDVTVDATTGVLTAVSAEPRVLPYPECPGAAPNVAWLLGVPVAELRSQVRARLRGPDCCTHLNDALRALADIPALLAAL